MLDITLNNKKADGRNKDKLTGATFDFGGFRERSQTMKTSGGNHFATVDPGIVKFEEDKSKEAVNNKKQ